MPVELDHTIVSVRDKHAAAAFLSDILGLAPPTQSGHFVAVRVDNDVTLDFDEADGEITLQHYAFRVSEAEFDRIFARIREQRVSYWADPARRRANEIYTRNGGRGVYFEDPSGHLLEILTRP